MLIHPGMAVYKNKEAKKPKFVSSSSIARNDSSNETDMTFNLHTGTHVDFPFHMQNGGKTSKDFDILTFVRPVRLFDLSHILDKIRDEDLAGLDIRENDFVLLKTRNSFSPGFNSGFVYLSEGAAKLLAIRKIDGVGIDALGIERDQPGHPTHSVLMNAGIWIIEGLSLKEVPAGDYHMTALPLKVHDVEALPLTVYLEETEK